MFECLHYEFLWRRLCSRTCQETDSYFSFAAWKSESELYWGTAMWTKIPAPTLGYRIARALNHWIWNHILGFSLTKFPRGQCLWQNLAITEQLFSISLPTPEWNDFQHLTFFFPKLTVQDGEYWSCQEGSIWICAKSSYFCRRNWLSKWTTPVCVVVVVMGLSMNNILYYLYN